MEVVDEVEEIDPGASETLTVDLEAGNCALICNIYDAGKTRLTTRRACGRRSRSRRPAGILR